MKRRRCLAWALLPFLAGCFAEPKEITEPGTTSDGQTETGSSTAGMDTSPTTAETSASASTSTSAATTQTPSTTASDVTTDPTTGDDGPSDSSTGEPATCGDGIVNQPDEMCDGTPGCNDECELDDYACNPLTNAGCIEGFRCGVADYDLETVVCMPVGDAALGEACSGVPNNDSDCGDGLTCVFNFATNYCDAGNCCVEFCDLSTQLPRCSNGATCMVFWPTPMYQGLEHLGLCRT